MQVVLTVLQRWLERSREGSDRQRIGHWVWIGGGGLLGHSPIPQESSVLDCDLPGRTCVLRSSASQTALGKEQLFIF